MNVEFDQIREYRLRAHHLDHKMPMNALLQVAGACGLQNSPPGAWETALIAQEGEQPWIYTKGIAGALEFMQMAFEDLLLRTKAAAKYLDSHTVKSKESLDRVLAEIIEKDLPENKRNLWRAPSMYGSPDKQTVGGAAVSFLLRPCSFSSLVVFGERQGISPTFTSLQNWTGRQIGREEAEEAVKHSREQAEKELVRRFLHCYGPAVLDSFMAWLGCSRQQAKRLWNGIKEEMEPVMVGNKTCYMLAADRENLLHPIKADNRLLLLGAHDPYLDIRDRAVILEDVVLQKAVWKTVENPGAILKGGRIVGIWKTKKGKNKLELSMTLFEQLEMQERKKLKELAEEYTAFRCI